MVPPCSASTNRPYTYHNSSGVDTGGTVPACVPPPPTTAPPLECPTDEHEHAVSPGWCHLHAGAPDCVDGGPQEYETGHDSNGRHTWGTVPACGGNTEPTTCSAAGTHRHGPSPCGSAHVRPACSPSTNIPYTYHNASGIDTGGTVPACPTPAASVQITGLIDGSIEGAGVVSEAFTVSPSSAVCSAGWVSGIVAVVSMSDNAGPVRVVAVDTGRLTGAVSVRVACSGAGYETATVSVVLTARPQGCTTALGSLGSLRVTRRGVWSADAGCLSSQRGNAQTPFYARFYTLSLDAAAEVTIDLSSSEDTYLYVLSGHGSSGTRSHYNDDAGSGTYDSQISVELAAGGYTIEATTYDARTTGGFTLTVATDIEDAPEPDPATVSGLAASYDATVGVLFSVGFTYEPEAAVLSVVSVTPSGLAFTRRDIGSAVGLAGTPSLAGVYTVALVLRQPGRVDTREFTVTATCRTGHTQQPDRSCEAPAPVVCTVSLGRGWVSSGTLVGSGSWESGCVLPEGRMGRGGVFYAKHFMFSLLFDAVVTIDLTSSDENSYLVLLEGYGAHGDEVDRDNDSGTGRNSRLANLSLDAGAYTVSASTYDSKRTGSFEVSLDAVLPLTVTGLESSYRATVGEEFLARSPMTPPPRDSLSYGTRRGWTSRWRRTLPAMSQ